MNEDTTVQKNNVMSAVGFLFSFKGRISRKQFWVFYLVVFLGAIILTAFTGVSSDIYEFTKPQLMFMLWILWPSLAVQAKRWHDQDKSALWLLINFIPIAGPVWSLVQNGFIPGTPGPNRFGPDPSEIQKKNTL
ncbi:MAG: DUF805 domain-containing protein [Nitrospiraceae bacterium]|nr:MAG: DUF805 domain-containing protein [Nitrospiraceae bacterium]